MAHATDIVGYTYKADQLCITCTGKKIVNDYHPFMVPESPDEIDALGKSYDIDVEDETSYDSDEWPKVIFRDMLGGERCGECNICLSCDGWGCDSCKENG